MVASAIFFLDSKGKPLLSRNYRGDIPMSTVDNFPTLLIENDDGQPPCITHEGISYLYVSHNNIYLLALTKRNSDAASILLFLHHMIIVLRDYFNELEEESIRDNFVVIYELLDEMMDFGHPQITDAKILQEYITQESHALASKAASSVVTNAISWRPEGIFYKKNELFLDVIESLNVVLNADGSVNRSEILGKISVNAFLSGMPQLKLGLNDLIKRQSNVETRRAKKYVKMDDVKFHQCVQLDEFEKDRTISFIPPDGKFELLSYRVKELSAKPLFLVDANVNIKSRSRVVINVKAKSQFRKRSVANNVEISIPVPRDADSPRFKASTGNVVYAPETNAIVWKIKNFAGGKDYSMSAELMLPSVISQEGDYDVSLSNRRHANNQPVQVKFEIPYFAVSGLQVRYLKVNEPTLKYPSLPWVRYLTQSGEEYSIRVPVKSTDTK
jgi:AP-1 complex subunit mu